MENYEIGDVVVSKVTGVEKYGIFVNVDQVYTGLIHISEVSYNFVRSVSDYAKVGEIIRAKVIAVDDINKKLRLSIKDMDYKINYKKYRKIEETPLGFSTLSDNLDGWVSIKKQELEEKEKI